MTFRFSQPLYPLVDSLGLAEATVAAGIRLLQLRVKNQPARVFVEIAQAVKQITDRAGARLIINDRADIARLVDAAGVHLGQDDLPPEAARAILGPDKIIGLSTHDEAQVAAAVRAGVVNYLGFGPIFPTRSKDNPDPLQGLDGLRQVRRIAAIPLVAIGGITAAHLPAVLAAGADAVAVIGAISGAPDPTVATLELLDLATRSHSPRRRN